MTDTTVRIGCVLPDDRLGSWVEAALRDRLQDLAGPVNGRTVALDVRRAPTAGLPHALADLVRDDPPFAVVAPFTRGQEAAMSTAAASIPLVAPIAGPRRETPGDAVGTWPVLPREEELVRVLVDSAFTDGPSALVLGADVPPSFVRAAEAQARRWGHFRRSRARIVYLGDPAGLAALRVSNPDARIYALGADAGDLRTSPLVLAWSTARGADLRGGHGHGRWAARGVPEALLDDVQSAVAGLELVVEALAATGRDLRRGAFERELEVGLGRHAPGQEHGLSAGRAAFVVAHDPDVGAREGRWVQPRN